MSAPHFSFKAGLGREAQTRFTRRLPSHKSVVAVAHSRTRPASADLHPAGNDRQAAGPTDSAPCLDVIAARANGLRPDRVGVGGGGST